LQAEKEIEELKEKNQKLESYMKNFELNVKPEDEILSTKKMN
jgi:hypothetical protein